MISSLSNAQVKRVRRLQQDKRFRYRERAYVVEGTRLLSEFNAQPQLLEILFCTAAWLSEAGAQAGIDVDRFSTVEVTEEVMAAMSATETAPGVLAVAEMHALPLPERPLLVLILDAVTTPGNLGTILRTSAAAAVDAVLLAPGCVDPYNPKVVRGGMGAHMRLPLWSLSWPKIADFTGRLCVWVTEAAGDTLYADVNWRQPSALIIGNEAHGAGKEARRLAQGQITIPMASAIESLNAATAAAIVLYEAFRQRGFGTGPGRG